MGATARVAVPLAAGPIYDSIGLGINFVSGLVTLLAVLMDVWLTQSGGWVQHAVGGWEVGWLLAK